MLTYGNLYYTVKKPYYITLLKNPIKTRNVPYILLMFIIESFPRNRNNMRPQITVVLSTENIHSSFAPEMEENY